ncbi:anaerobic glycerol-3-phosphate dehydrogenase subunit GlpB [uncultured Desulfovibrio sp.]|uniref:anaerobic glycerol-3-phosphate dehydrogenase subunit GlpB n=1 Tax=uncultured Desulfovibrio sp. TaxID=167968 RepID=UPI0028062DA7|nr:anaerobic glycerol-3-phosphate dehydrogenase subunit GlpB [uncultured Desulfovibrio sp.]
MSRTTDVIVVGSGLAGLMAALAAARQGREVRVISEGMGCLAIGSGYVDILGYAPDGTCVEDPWTAMATLPATHPYSLLGADRVRSALDALVETAGRHGLGLHAAEHGGSPRNTRVPTIMGTLRPTYLVPDTVDPVALAKARHILVASVRGFRDCRPALVIDQLRRYPDWADKEFTPCIIPAPFDDAHRALNALDLARAAERPGGRDWLADALKERAAGCDLVLLPPICGCHAASGLAADLSGTLGCPVVEMPAIPPGVGGLRLRDALLRELASLGVEMVENADVIDARVAEGRCLALTIASTGRSYTTRATAYVLATGGILAGGITLAPGSAHERVFKLEIPLPEDVGAWTEPAIFGNHAVASLGVRVDASLRPLDGNGALALENVFFAGRTLGGHDPAVEKSGYGVALATGWHAGLAAAELAGASHCAGEAATGGKQ